jgi:hypothetical protein
MLSLFTNFSTVPLFSTISTIQIASMLPLINITVPSNALSFYKILVTFIAFDFIPQMDLGFTTQKPFNDKFALYGFDSTNFVQNMGVLFGLVLFCLFMFSFMVVVVTLLGNKAKRASSIVRRTTAVQAWTKALFVMYIALMISSIIAFKMWGIRDYWNGMDKLAVTAHLGGLVILYLFPLFVSWFVVYKSRQYITIKAVEKLEKHSDLVCDTLKTAGDESDKEKDDVLKTYEAYEPFFEGRDRTSYMSQYSHLVFLFRRVALVLAIFGLDKQNWALWQVITFWLSSLLVLMFNCGAKPFETRYQRYVETFNEAIVLLTGYFATQLVMSGRSVAMLQQIGYGLAGVISIFLVVTLVLLAVLMLKHSKLVLLNIYKRMVLRQRKAKHAAVKEIELYNCKSINDDEKPRGTPLYDDSINGSLPAINRDSMINPLVTGPIAGHVLSDLQQVIDNKNNAYGTASKLISSRIDESYDLQDL